MTYAQCVGLFNQVKKIIPDNGKLRISRDGAHSIPDIGINQELGQVILCSVFNMQNFDFI